MKKLTFKNLWEVLKDAFKGFGEDKVPKLSASLAYYTVFSMGPLLIVIIYLCSIFFGRAAAEETIYHQIDNFVGRAAADQIQDIIKNASVSNKGTVAAIIGFITLLIGATTVFAEIQDSINTIWGLKPKPKQGFLLMLKSRLLSFSVIVSLGFLLLVSLGVTAIIEALGSRLKAAFPDVTVVVFYIINLLITLAVVTALFGVIFKVLPDARIKWKDVLAGAIATALLFILGKFAISFYIAKSDVGSTYGTAGSLVILILWIYYSSIILYFGAEFTRAYAERFGGHIRPAPYAVWVKKEEVEQGQGSIKDPAEKGKKHGLFHRHHHHDPQPEPSIAMASGDAAHEQEEHPRQENTAAERIRPEVKSAASRPAPSTAPTQVEEVEAVPVDGPRPAYAIKVEKKPGILTLLGGLAIYVVSTAGKDKIKGIQPK